MDTTPDTQTLRLQIGAREILLRAMVERSMQRDRIRAPWIRHPRYWRKDRASRYDSRARIKRARAAIGALRAELAAAERAALAAAL